jgi:hypothetical protein
MMIEVAKISFTATKKSFNTTVKRNVLQISGMGVTNTIRQTQKASVTKSHGLSGHRLKQNFAF